MTAPTDTVQSNNADGHILTSFDGQSALLWQAVNDNVMGGRSRGGFVISDGRLLFSGEINTNGGGFASVRTAPSQLNLAKYAGLKARIRGDGRIYKFRVVAAEPNVSYMAEISTRKGEWQVVEVLFSSFSPSWRGRSLQRPPLDPAEISSIGFMLADKRDGAFALEVDWIRVMPSE